MKIGFIGLGNTGAAMAANLVEAGNDVTVYNRSPAKADTLAARGATPACTVADACGGDVVVTMLSDDTAVEDVTFSDGGVLKALPSGATHVSSSTISVDLSKRLTAAHTDAGQHHVAAPVFGRPEAAAAAELFVVAAGRPQALEPLGPLFDAIGQRTFVVSEHPHTANLVKLAGRAAGLAARKGSDHPA